MKNGKLSKILTVPLLMMLGITLAATSACTPEEAQLLKGILENVDSAKGTVTITTNDGKTVTLKIDTKTEVNSEGANVTAIKLETGAPVEIKVKKGDRNEQVAQRIDAKRPPVKADWGIIEVRVTDPPPAAVKSAVVYYKSIEVHMTEGYNLHSANTTASGNVTLSSTPNPEEDSGWITVISTPGSFDLMNVIGAEKILGSANLSAGKFTQIRMDVTRVEGITTDNVSYSAEVPSDKLKIIGNFSIGGGAKTVLTLDFDGEKSLIRTGEGKFLFKPVVKLLVNNQGKTTDNRSSEPQKPNSTANATNSKKAETTNNSTKNTGDRER